MEKNEILMVYGSNPSDMAIKIAEAAVLSELIGDKKKRIGLKPNLVMARTADEGATTHPEIAAGLIAYLRKNGFSDIVILEGSWVGGSTTGAFSACGYKTLAKEAGVELIDTKTGSYKAVDCRGITIEICDSALALDFMINLPVLKGHCQTRLSCALKNNKGVISDREKRRFHSLGLHKPIAHLNTKVRNDFIVVDGICGDPDFEEGGNPVYGGRVFAARDPVLCDAWAASLMGYRIEEIPYIGLAEKLGIGVSGPARLRELNKNSEAPPPPLPSGKAKQLSAKIREENACSACYAGLIFALLRLDRTRRERLAPVCIGQGFRGKKGTLGVGVCTAGFSSFCPGCPPTGAEILEFLKTR
ncbi:MAG: DUF362 domain-containing protein [Treponema sp.]|nr:DUF362 domain-containing protein [Treponema sp.]